MTTLLVLAIVLVIAVLGMTVVPVIRITLALANAKAVSFGAELRWNAPFMILAEVTLVLIFVVAGTSLGFGSGIQPSLALLWLLCLISPVVWWFAAAAVSAYLTRAIGLRAVKRM